ncbi:hypothetical protein EZV62_026355 [Acer yangbiense]|uniref:FBD domain-containing protein n=1 Tax=Acer yangbiense TaxID=1000413 RepID=A0A5C7GQI4_9ROSI|nr:hypothetical protein EZV62_026355 [Acer yangbiense]
MEEIVEHCLSILWSLCSAVPNPKVVYDQVTIKHINIQKLGEVKPRFLSLVIDYKPVMCPHFYGNLPFFPNLIYLDFGFDILAGFELLVEFLNNSPDLEVLVLEEFHLDHITSNQLALDIVEQYHNSSNSFCAYQMELPFSAKKAYILVHRFVVRARNLEYLHVCNDSQHVLYWGRLPS